MTFAARYIAIFAFIAALSLLAGAGFGQTTQPANAMRILFFTKSSGYQHDVIKRNGDQLGLAERVMLDLGKKHGFTVTPSKDGQVFEPDAIGKWDAFIFYTSGDLTQPGTDGQPPMSEAGKKALLDAVAGGKAFIGVHCASDTFQGPKDAKDGQFDPYIHMLGGRFSSHGDQQKATLTVADPKFPGVPQTQQIELLEEWYAYDQTADDRHVVLTQETKGMEGSMYQVPPYPTTWTRTHGKGRVFYTGLGHRDDVWTSPMFQSLLAGGINWATGRAR